MDSGIKKIKELLSDYSIDLSDEQINRYMQEIETGQQFFSQEAQLALILKLFYESDTHQEEKIITTSTEACRIEGGICVTTFGILSPDWAGLSNACMGLIHAMGWNIYFVKGLTIKRHGKSMGLLIIAVRTEAEEDYNNLLKQTKTILTQLVSAAYESEGKSKLMFEEIRKMLIYNSVITYIEETYREKNLDAIVGPNGEAFQYFNARSRDYIENRSVQDIAEQIIRNYIFIKRAHKTNTIQLDISNIQTKKEGMFTGVTVSGPAKMLNLEDALKTIELSVPGYLLKHNREFTTKEGISCFRIEFVDQMGHPLSEFEHSRLKKAFSRMVLNKRTDRAQWIASIGGFEQYARAIIPLLVREAQSTGITQVYESVDRATDLFITFKIITVIPEAKETGREILSRIIKNIEAVGGMHILSVKPPKTFGKSILFIFDIKASFADIENAEAIYRLIREILQDAIGEYRDFDEGMRSIDTTKLKTVCRMIEDIDGALVREIYYSLEDFFRINATLDELIGHIRITSETIMAVEVNKERYYILSKTVGTHNKAGDFLPQASLLCIAYPHNLELLDRILEIMSDYEITMSRMERASKDILICRMTIDEKALDDDSLNTVIQNIHALIKEGFDINPYA